MTEEFYIDKANHKYYYRGSCRNIISVTTLIQSLFPEFSPKTGLEKLKKGDKWNKNHPLWGKSDKYIWWFWEKTNERKRILGVQMHELIEHHIKISDELLMKNKPTELINPRHYNEFIEYFKDFVPRESEMPIFSKELRIAGTPDLLMAPLSDPSSNKRILIDWKRIKNIKKHGMELGLVGTPMEKIVDCKYQKFHMQLNIYRYILETCYGYEIIGMSLIMLHPQLKTFKLEDVEKDDKVIEQLKIFRLQQLIHPK